MGLFAPMACCNDVFQAGHAFSLEQSGNAQARDVGIDVLPGNVQQVVERQIERLAQWQHDGLLRRAQRGVQRMSPVRTVLHIVPLEPLGSRGTGDVEDLVGLEVGQSGVLDFLQELRGCAGLGMNA